MVVLPRAVVAGALSALLAVSGCSGSDRPPEGDTSRTATSAGSGVAGMFRFNTGASTPEPASEGLRSRLLDEQGRVVILRGVNVESASKSKANNHLPASGLDRQRELLRWGWNAVRFVVTWAAIEPNEGTYDESYLDQVGRWLDWYADHQIHVVLDMHQDLYSERFGGDGAPDWAVFSDGLNFGGVPEGGPWYLAATDPATQVAYQNFWDPARGHADELQRHYLDALSHLANRFKDHAAVIGYDIMNEPVFANGDLDATVALIDDAAAGRFRNDRLMDFTRRAIRAVRAVDTDNWVFFEPTSLLNAFPFPTDLDMAGFEDPRQGAPRLGYAPHLYETSAHDGIGYPEGSPYVAEWERLRVGEAATLGGPLWLGEVGAGPDTPRMDAYVDDIMAMADRSQAGWAWWSWDPGGWSPVTPAFDLSENGRRLLRVQPRAIAGEPTSFRWDAIAKRFEMNWEERAGVDAQTELAVPESLYPDGFAVVLDGNELATPAFDAERSVLAVRPATEASHTVCVAPARTACG